MKCLITSATLMGGKWILEKYPNLNNYQEVVETIDKIYNKYKKIDVLINNAGISTVKLLNKSKLEEVKALFNVNYFRNYVE